MLKKSKNKISPAFTTIIEKLATQEPKDAELQLTADTIAKETLVFYDKKEDELLNENDVIDLLE